MSRILFVTLQFAESDFYGRVGARLEQRGHEVAHVTVSRRSAEDLRAAGARAWCLPDELAALGSADADAEAARIEGAYAELLSLRDVYRTDPAAGRLSEPDAIARTIAITRALERIMEEFDPEVVIPEVGSETVRTMAHHVARARGASVLYLFFTIFPRPLRLYRDSYHAPIVGLDELRELTAAERAEVEEFIAGFTAAGKPLLAHRKARVTAANLRDFGRHVRVAATQERDNEYLRPHRFVTNLLVQRARRLGARRLYDELDPQRPFVYFPLHVTDDFKVKRVIPHCVDQESLIRQIAEALPQGIDVVLKEHPVSVGRNPLAFLRRLRRIPNVRLVDPHTSSHELIQRAAAVTVISSTVGLEALLYARPVLTLGQPFYAGYGVTVDVDSFREIREALPAVLAFEPDREQILRFLHAAMRACWPGKPGGVDPSDANAETLAGSLDGAIRQTRDPAPA